MHEGQKKKEYRGNERERGREREREREREELVNTEKMKTYRDRFEETENEHLLTDRQTAIDR